jgi:translation initiation factor IF-2
VTTAVLEEKKAETRPIEKPVPVEPTPVETPRVENGAETVTEKVEENPVEKVEEKPVVTPVPVQPTTPTQPAQQKPVVTPTPTQPQQPAATVTPTQTPTQTPTPIRPLQQTGRVPNIARNQGQVRDLNTRQGQTGNRPQTSGGSSSGGSSTTGGGGSTTGGGSSTGNQRPTPAQGTTGGRPLGQRPITGQRGGQQPQNRKPADQQTGGPKKIGNLPSELQLQGRSSITIEELRKKQREHDQGNQQPVVGQQAASAGGNEEEELEGDDKHGGTRKPTPGKGQNTPGRGVVGRDQRHKDRQRGREGGVSGGRVSLVAGKLVVEEDTNRRGRKHHKQEKRREPTIARKGKVPISLPITVRSLSEAVGKRSGELLLKLMTFGQAGININSILDPETAEAIALEYGCELDIKRQETAEERTIREAESPDSPEDLVPRAPIVTIMGHVDHGKTTLLDKIRHSDVAAGEIGGITQVIRAWRVDHGGRPITFLDTPGHEAFTKMRARGANVTDIAIIVVAVNDGVMPQTEEAIAHAKAAGVSIIVALNKIDLPDANLKKTEQQLYGLGLIPDTMGGDVQFVQVSGKTGKGIPELLDTISLVAELKELKANPKKPARGVCLEAHLDPDEGVFATLLIRDGTLKKGDTIVCGGTFGRVRAIYSDLGRSMSEAGPTVPVRVTGLDSVPNADDPFQVVEDVIVAREIAETRKTRAQESSMTHRTVKTLDDLGQMKVTELKVILKAEARGSIEAIRAELEKLQHDEVRVRLLHTAIGGISESDVQLALTSPDDTLILGFNVVADDRARALAEDRGIQIRLYNIIYQLTDDIRSALEGKLKPREEIVFLGRAVVRKTFKITKVGTIAGCYVTKGVIERNAKVRVIRNGIVVYPPADRTVGLESLKRVKDDVREVKEGNECGIKIAGYDDIKVDDIIESYRIDQVMRTLS